MKHLQQIHSLLKEAQKALDEYERGAAKLFQKRRRIIANAVKMSTQRKIATTKQKIKSL